jgi:hypothetical protein
MNRLMASLLSLLLAFFVGIAAAATWLSPQQKKEATPPAPQRQVEATPVTTQHEFALVIPPKTSWEPIFFESIDERAKKAKLPTLRAPLPEGDIELRVWGGFGLTTLEGFRLRRNGARWSATHLDTDYRNGRFVEYEQLLAQPKSGWEGAWNRLVSLGVLELPDAESAGCSTRINDGFSYVVETNVNRVYRTYMYDNPHHSKCEEARRMLSIAAAIADEFGVEEFRGSEDSRP